MIPTAVICLTTHNRVDCARINEEIIKLNYKARFPIVHACSGARGAPYLEDAFIGCEALPLQSGAINLLQKSIGRAVEQFAPRYLIHLEADTWILDEEVLLGFIRRMESNPRLLLATSAWTLPERRPIRRTLLDLREIVRHPGESLERLKVLPHRATADIEDFSTQFFVIRNEPGVIQAISSLRADGRQVERSFFDAYTRRYPLDRVLRMREREPVLQHRYFCEDLHLYCQHWPARGTSEDPRPPADPLYVDPNMIGKKESLLRYPHITKGESIQRLLTMTDFDDYNVGAIRY